MTIKRNPNETMWTKLFGVCEELLEAFERLGWAIEDGEEEDLESACENLCHMNGGVVGWGVYIGQRDVLQVTLRGREITPHNPR